MMKVLRKFSITPTATLEERNADFQFGKEYPVLAIRRAPESGSTLLLVADDRHELYWVDMDHCFLYAIEDKPGFGAAFDEEFLDAGEEE